MRDHFENQARALLKSFLFAFRGIRFCIKNERNMRIHTAAAIFVTAFSLVYKLEPVQYAVLFLTMGAVISFEAVNTALESLVNLASPAYHNLARIAKDTAAGAVLISAITAIIVAVCLFGDPARLKDTFCVIFRSPLLIAGFSALTAAGLWFIFRGDRIFKN